MTPTKTTALSARKNLIAQIAQRHAAEREFIKSTAVKLSTENCSEYDTVIAEEFAALQNTSTTNPSFS